MNIWLRYIDFTMFAQYNENYVISTNMEKSRPIKIN